MFVVRSMLDEFPELITLLPRSTFTRYMSGGDYAMLPLQLIENNAPIGFVFRRDLIASGPIEAFRNMVREALQS